MKEIDFFAIINRIKAYAWNKAQPLAKFKQNFNLADLTLEFTERGNCYVIILAGDRDWEEEITKEELEALIF